MRILVTGGAGCIGSELCEALLARSHQVTVLDNLSSGTLDHLSGILNHPQLTFINADMLDRQAVEAAVSGQEMIYHLAANSDVKLSPDGVTDNDLKHNMIATHHLLEAVSRHGVGGVAFSSTSAVYGLTDGTPIREDAPLRPISLYGATKAGSEALLSALHGLYGTRCWVFRFANIIGPRVRIKGRTVISDFIHRLRENPRQLTIFGNGQQSKSYLLSAECIAAMLHIVDRAPGSFNVFNIAGTDTISVRKIADMVVEAMGLRDVEYLFTGGEGGWPGDVPRFRLDVTALSTIGWRATRNSEQAVAETITAMLQASAVGRPGSR